MSTGDGTESAPSQRSIADDIAALIIGYIDDRADLAGAVEEATARIADMQAALDAERAARLRADAAARGLSRQVRALMAELAVLRQQLGIEEPVDVYGQ